jgi:hypothetical protein
VGAGGVAARVIARLIAALAFALAAFSVGVPYLDRAGVALCGAAALAFSVGRVVGTRPALPLVNLGDAPSPDAPMTADDIRELTAALSREAARDAEHERGRA